jgi:hypothetical protein
MRLPAQLIGRRLNSGRSDRWAFLPVNARYALAHPMLARFNGARMLNPPGSLGIGIHARRMEIAEAYTVDAVRTPVGRKKGGLAQIHPADLGGMCSRR